jgi:hypothetical protein
MRIVFRLTLAAPASVPSPTMTRDYVLVRDLTAAKAEEIMGGARDVAHYFHSWNDGWVAQIDCRRLGPRERDPHTDGFAGYDWMVSNIVAYGSVEKPA